MKEALYNLIDKDGEPWAQEKWTQNEDKSYKVEIRYLKSPDKTFKEATHPSMNTGREQVFEISSRERAEHILKLLSKYNEIKDWGASVAVIQTQLNYKGN